MRQIFAIWLGTSLALVGIDCVAPAPDPEQRDAESGDASVDAPTDASTLDASALDASALDSDADSDAAADAGCVDGTACGVARVCIEGTCRPSTCGDGVADPRTEDCDDGNDVAGDGCEPECTFSCVRDQDCLDDNVCNGFERCFEHQCRVTPIGEYWPCPLPDGERGQCRERRCVVVGCGNSLPDPDEECDDGNEIDGDGCDSCVYSCHDDDECSDADVCTGTESCRLDTHTCVPGEPLVCEDSIPCTVNECDPEAGCRFPLIDGDGDGQASADLGACGTDCDDEYAARFIGNPEICDGLDNDCDGVEDDDPAPCPSNASCRPLGALAACQCDVGYAASAGGDCADVDECADGTHSCVAPFECTNSVGSYECLCPPGEEPDGMGGCRRLFDIVVEFLDAPSADLRAAFAYAEARWEAVLMADLPGYTGLDARCEGPASGDVDDLYVAVRLTPIDGGGGTFAAARPVCFRESPVGSYLTITGRMDVDPADVGPLAGSGQLGIVILHELGHVLGIGSAWDNLALLQDPACTLNGTSCESGHDPRYLGPQANAAWTSLGGAGLAPVENSLGVGAMDFHWREGSPLATELMSSVLSSQNLLSTVSLRSLADLGYPVGPDTLADPIVLPSFSGPRPTAQLQMVDDVAPGPRYSVDGDGTLHVH